MRGGWLWVWAVGCATPAEKGVEPDTDTDTPAVETDVQPTADTSPPVDSFDYLAVPPMFTLEPGIFQMGSPLEELGRSASETLHTVTLTHRVELSSVEISQGQFEAQRGYDPSLWAGCSQCPVERVSWNEAAAYTVALSVAQGLTACYTCTGSAGGTECTVAVEPYACTGYRLPTSAEWEYAARAQGTVSGATPSGGSIRRDGDLGRCDLDVELTDSTRLGEQAWYCGTSDATPGNTTRPVGQLVANAVGMHDALGNVWEHTHDVYSDEEPVDAVDPVGPVSGDYRTIRGGGWNSSPREVRVAFKTSTFPRNKSDNLGFRIARTLDP